MRAQEVRVPRLRLVDLGGAERLAVGCFAVLVLGFLLLAEVNLFVHVGEGAGPPSPAEVLAKYHGDPDRTLLEQVLDPNLPYSDPHNMSQFLGGYQEDEVTQTNRKKIFDWIAYPMRGSLSRTFFRAPVLIRRSSESCTHRALQK